MNIAHTFQSVLLILSSYKLITSAFFNLNNSKATSNNLLSTDYLNFVTKSIKYHQINTEIIIFSDKFQQLNNNFVINDLQNSVQFSIFQLHHIQNRTFLPGKFCKSLFDVQLQIIVESTNKPKFLNLLKLFCLIKKKCFELNQNISIKYFKPNFIFLVPNNFNFIDLHGRVLLQKLLAAGKVKPDCFQIDNPIYFVFPKSNASLINSTTSEIFYKAFKFTIFEVYSVKNITVSNEISDSESNNNSWFQILESRLQRTANFHFAQFRAVCQESEEFESVSLKEIDGQLRFISGFGADYFKLLADILNISVLAVRSKGYIAQNKSNGELIGMAKQLLEDQADVSITHSEYLIYRQKYLDFLHPHFVGRVIAFFKQPPSRFGRDIYIKPLGHNARLLSVTFWILIIICFYLVSKIRNKYLQPQQNDDDEHTDYTLYTIASMCQQGWHRKAENFPIKVILLTSLFFGLTLYIGFSATIVSQLSISQGSIQSFNDITNKTTMKIYVDEFTFQPLEYLEKVKADGSLKNEVDKYLKLNVGFETIKEQSATYIAMQDEFYRSINPNISDRLKCDVISEVNVSPIGLPMIAKAGITLKKNSPFKKHLKFAQLKIQQSGLLLRLQENYLFRSKPKCDHTRKKFIGKLGLHDVFTPLVILICGIIFASISLVIEFSSYCIKTKIIF